MRKLASIQKVRNIFEHPNADLLELAQINGWICVVRKEDFKAGDLGVYFEIDAFLPADDDRYEFLSPTFRTFEGKSGARIKSIKLRRALSQGLILPISMFPEIINPEIGQDVTDLLGVVKWEKPQSNSVDAKGNFPSFIEQTDQERIQNLTWLDRSGLWEKTEKMEGTSLTIYYVQGELALESSKDLLNEAEPSESYFGVCSRNIELKESDSAMWAVVMKYNLKERLEKLGRNLALQGEIIGPKIEDNIYRLKTYHFILFDIYDIDNNRKLLADERMKVWRKLNEMDGTPIELPPIIEYVELPQSDDWMEILLQDADGMSALNPETMREGFVYKHIEKNLSFKVVSNTYLLNND
jgi:RNA ligase (TIGR02306 family)